jgi:hypothetical protein
MNNFFACFSAEWLKKQRSFADWLVWIGGLFIPVINTIVFLVYPKQLLKLHAQPDFWQGLFYKSWESMSVMLLPMGIVLAVSLVTQIEFKNNCWKQLHTTPASFTSIFFSKMAVLAIMLLQLFILFNLGIYLSGVIPSLFHASIPFPSYTIPIDFVLVENGKFLLACLPLMALQYLISLQFKNFLIPIGAGLALVIAGLIALSWKYIYLVPSAYTALNYFQHFGKQASSQNILLWAFGYFCLFTALGYILYLFKKEKG